MMKRLFSHLLTLTAVVAMAAIGSPCLASENPGVPVETGGLVAKTPERASPIFVENVGQFDEGARFRAYGGGYDLWLTNDALWLTAERQGQPHYGVALQFSFSGANPHPVLEPLERLETSINYFIGDDPAQWRTDVPTWSGVRYRDLYPGVDLEVTGERGRWAWRIVCRSNCQFAPKKVILRVKGADAIALEERDGDGVPTHLRLTTAAGDLTLPLLQAVALDLAAARPGIAGDKVIAPLAALPFLSNEQETSRAETASGSDLLFSTFLGGPDFDSGKGIAVDGSGAAYVTGYAGHDFPTTAGAYDTIYSGGIYDAFVAKLSADGSSPHYITFLGGDGTEMGHDVVVDDAGTAVYVVGQTDSSNLPTTAGAFQPTLAGGSDAFVARLNAGGNGLVYATYLGGSSWEEGRSIAVGGSGDAYVVGTTKSNDFPTTAGAYTGFNATQDVFVARLNAQGSALVYATCLGGERWDWGYDIAVDDSGAAYVTGDTYGYDFPTTPGAFDTTHSGQYSDAFVAKFSPDGGDLVYATFLSGTSGRTVTSSGLGIAVDGSGTAYVAGRTAADDFPTTAGAFQTAHSASYDAFVVRLNASGSDVLYATYLGGSDHDVAHGIVVDDSGLVYVVGETGSTDLPTTAGAIQPTLASNWYTWYDAFVAVLKPAGKGAGDLLYATYLGGREDDSGAAIALHAASRTVYVTGFTVSDNFPVTAGAFDTTYGGGVYGQEPYGDAFVTRIQPGNSQVKAVTPCIGGPYYFRPWPASVSNNYQAQIDWRDHTPAYVDFALNGSTAREGASGDVASHAFDLNALTFGLLGTRNTLTVQAVTAEGIASPPYTLYPIGVESPAWLPAGDMQQEVPAGCTGQPMKATWAIAFPDPALEATVTPPSWLPFIGGSPFGLKQTQAELEVKFSGNGEGSAKISGQTGFDVADQQVTGRAFGEGTGNVSEGEGARLQGASLGLEVEGAVEAERPLVDVICQAASGGTCPLREAESLPVVGSVVRWFNERARFEAIVQPTLQLAFNFAGDPSGLRWDGGTGTGKVKLTLALVLDAVEDLLTAEGYGGGEPSITLQTPPDPSYLKEVAVKIFAGVKLKVWRWEQSFEAPYEWSFAPTGSPGVAEAESPGFRALAATGWHPIPRDYAASYAVFQANKRPVSLEGGVGIQATEEDAIATNVFSEGHPAIASNGNVLLLWVHDDVSKPLMQGEEIYYSIYDGTSWTAPAGITDDNLQDFAPQVAFDGNGNAVAVWERNKAVQSASSEFDAAYANAFKIAYAVWDGSTWSSPAYLTGDDSLEHAPVLARGSDGTLLLVYRQNTAGELVGSSTNLDTFYYTLWDGAAWSTPVSLPIAGNGVLGLAAARHDGNAMAVAYSQDTGGDLSTGEDQELYYLGWDGSSWSSTRLTADSQPDSNPALFYDAGGAPRLLWLKGDTLYALLGSLSGTPQAVATHGSAAVLDYAAAQDNAGNLVLLWQGYSDLGVDVFYATYDQAHGIFSLVEQLTHDEPLEKFMSPAFAPTGAMVMAYNKTALVTETVAVSSTLAIDHVTSFGQTDLYVLHHTFGPDLMLGKADLATDPANPAPGSAAQIFATLHNAGDQSVANPRVAFYQGDPDAGGVLIGTAMGDLTLAGGMTATLSVDWPVPASGGPFAIYAVADPDGAVTELNEANNTAHFFAAVPDLVMEGLQVAYGSGQAVTLTAVLNNAGVVAAAPVTLTFRLDDPVTGAAVAQANAPGLAAGAGTEIVAVWDATGAPTGRCTVYAIVDPDDRVVEAVETNNVFGAGVGVLPDLVLRSTAVATGITPDGNRVVSVWVFNEGLRDANGVVLGIYDQLPGPGSVPLASTTLDVQAGQHRVVTLDLGSYVLPGFYAAVGIDGEVEDREGSDNVLLVGQALPNRLYLPAIFKGYAPP